MLNYFGFKKESFIRVMSGIILFALSCVLIGVLLQYCFLGIMPYWVPMIGFLVCAWKLADILYSLLFSNKDDKCF